MSNGNAKILVVEDEPSQLELLCYNLSRDGYETYQATCGEDATIILKETRIDLVLLDWMLPQTSGLEICRQIKRSKHTKNIPVVMLTARGEEEDKVRGLDVGANDYLVKPYSIKELLARVRASLRSVQATAVLERLIYNGIGMDVARCRVCVNDRPVQLGPLEFKLLRVFLENPHRVFSRDQLLERVWENKWDIDTRTVDVHIGRLRKQLSLDTGQKYIRTVRGFGYSLDKG